MATTEISQQAPAGRLADKVAIITGASSGLGRAIALAYSREGAKVVCADLREDARSQIKTETMISTVQLLQKEAGKDRVIFCKTDVSKAEEIEALVEKAVETFGRLDVMVNNAGIAPEPTFMHRATEEQWDLVMNVNARSVFLGCKYAISQMLKQLPHSSGDRGWIVNMSSCAGIVGLPRTPTYSAAKGAVVSMTRQVAVDYARHRIHCNVLCPGYTQTAILADTFSQLPAGSSVALGAMHPFKGLGSAEDIAGPAVFLASKDAQWATGVVMPIDGGYSAQ
ncbi:NAD(P)-binding protein [Viridothelium virens]|uniref:NAD(P)-binding protein n=1 Tax=Viridothelium virens TaxID=1048519 RepID=A0A6A6HIC2_VIRVR|nr:NAD(P)-binding protein [Viridothelium virens]